MKKIATYKNQWFDCCYTCEHSQFDHNLEGQCDNQKHKDAGYYRTVDVLGTCDDYKTSRSLKDWFEGSDKNITEEFDDGD